MKVCRRAEIDGYRAGRGARRRGTAPVAEMLR
jgi:hypothetical protein